MKYLKMTMTMFVCTFLFTVMGVNAADVGITLDKVQVPKLNSVYSSSAKGKSTWNKQYIYKTKAYNNSNQKNVDILARVTPQTAGMQSSSWVTTQQSKDTYFNDNSAQPGSWKVQLKNKTNNITSSFFGVWVYNA